MRYVLAVSLTVIAVSCLFLIANGSGDDYTPVTHSKPLSPHVTQVQDDFFFAPRKYAGELNRICADKENDGDFWYNNTNFEEVRDDVTIQCTYAQRFPKAR